MLSESMAEGLVTYGFPLFWIGVGVVQWLWPSALFVAFSDEDVTPGARGFAVLWVVVGSVLALLFVPWTAAFGGWFVPGTVFVVVGGLQLVHPVWSLGERSGAAVGVLLLSTGTAALVVGLL
ncbi:hypothetical protein SAMN04488065_1823 [Haloplanus vescus]|uniref:Uncharacterized protein n=1 Tax=Haloplanus vescus TaxID=555874 RepID=A0A1H3YE51_9EURY|nr:hypothetical protein [Haloplanus vescus]SEA09803.1 hypothetical protein SAMN04488065_1823 [Haloplanus vescus]